VGIEYVRTIEDKKTSTVYLMADKGGNQIAGVYLGTMAYESLIKQEDVVSESFAIISPGNVSDMQRLPGMYRSSKVPFIFDPGQEIPLLSSEDLKNGISGSRALISNDYELSLIIKKTGWTQEDILSNTEILITTLGENGSRIQTKSAVYQIPAIKIEKFVDATGAGDAYRAGLIKGMLLGWPVDVCGGFASVVAGYAVEVYGPQGYSVDFKKVSERYKKEFQKNLPGL
jgi:adenosine kinase